MENKTEYTLYNKDKSIEFIRCETYTEAKNYQKYDYPASDIYKEILTKRNGLFVLTASVKMK